MTPELRFVPGFKKDVKRIPRALKDIVRSVHIPAIAAEPSQGAMLIGVYAGYQSFHFHYERTQYRIAYRYDELQNLLVFISIATRQNFYRDMRRRLS